MSKSKEDHSKTQSKNKNKNKAKTPHFKSQVKLRPLEREDLHFVHQLDNNASVMRYWFEEAYETFAELAALYEEHIHDQSERRFVLEAGKEYLGLVELVDINHVHRRAEFQIIISPDHQGKGLASYATQLAMDYGFSVLNLYKLYLIVDNENAKAIHIYEKLGFMTEGLMRGEFFISGIYRDVIRMCIFQDEYLKRRQQQKAATATLTPTAQ